MLMTRFLMEPSSTEIMIVIKSQNPLKWNKENWIWSWESNFIPFDKKFKCTRKCARNLARYSNSESDIIYQNLFILNNFRKPKRCCCCWMWKRKSWYHKEFIFWMSRWGPASNSKMPRWITIFWQGPNLCSRIFTLSLPYRKKSIACRSLVE